MTVFRGIILAALSGLVAVIFYLPLSWIAPRFVPEIAGKNLSYSGTIWQGSVQGVDLLDDVNFSLKPHQIFSAHPLRLEGGNGVNYLTAELGRGAAKDLRLTLNVAELPLPDQRLTGLMGTVNLRVAAAEFSDRCTSASGTVTTDILRQNGGNFNWTGPELSGPISCEDGQVVMRLTGDEAGQTIAADIRIDPAGSYRADISVTTNQAEASAVLPLFGFSQTGREYKLTEQGNWR